MKTLKQACAPRPATFDPSRRDTVLDLSDLVEDRIDPAAFFAENAERRTTCSRSACSPGIRSVAPKS